MTDDCEFSPTIVIQRIGLAWLAYAGLWVLAITAERWVPDDTGLVAVPAFGLAFVAAFLVTGVVTARALFQVLRSASPPRWVLIISVVSAIGVIVQLWYVKVFFLG
ncbi:MAG TPA: hypothetical protein VJN70_07745 [Gemmatimonadaceae bacterium]|nr:hypothetical protein [Gemmatimonadaceae bacterium]